MHAALGGAPRAPSDAHTQTHRARSSSEGPNATPTGPRRLTCERVLLHAPPPRQDLRGEKRNGRHYTETELHTETEHVTETKRFYVG